MKRTFTWLVLVGGVLVVLAVLWQAFSIAAYVRGAGDGALDAHGAGSLFVHIGQLAIVIGAIVAYWGNWRMVGGAVGFLVLAIAQLAFLGDTDEEGDWINGLHGFLAVVIALLGVWYANRAANDLGVRRSGGVAGSA
ncbi:MAG TPA: hypothetical protein VFO64_00565 [Gaiellaceae bacterium]|jgi:hypothetical protein|nr:hypothetical protein [Gaiellaceae bacterium]